MSHLAAIVVAMTTTSRGQGPTFEQMRAGLFVPGRNSDPAALAIKHAHIRDRHVAPINALADRVADSAGFSHGLVPYADPQLGGVDAEVLALLDNPSTKAEAGTGSGLLSLENDDPTARHCAEVYNDFGLRPGRVVHWNVAPAPIAGPKNGKSSGPERDRGAVWLRELLEMLPNLRVILLMGAMARDGWKKSGLAPDGIVIPVDVPHPSNRGMRNTDAELRLHRGLVATMTALDGPGLSFPPEPEPSSGPRASGKRARVAAQSAAPTPALSAADPALSDGEMWGWWPTREHYSSPGANPWATSRRLRRIEADIDQLAEYSGKFRPIARLRSAEWVLELKREYGRTNEMTSDQAGKYSNARRGLSRGTLGPVPPAAELARPTVDLDASS